MKKRTRKIGRKRFLAGLLSLAMVLTLTPVTASADTASNTTTSQSMSGNDEGNASTDSHYDDNGFCKEYEIDPNGSGAWVPKSGDEACMDDSCNGYQPMTKVTEDGTTWYEISNAGQLYWFADQADNGKLLDANVRLTADIVDNEGVTFGWDENNDYAVVATKDGQTVDASTLRMWNPIGNNKGDKHYFAGHFDGQGHIVSGLYYSKGTDTVAGIFSGVVGVKNNYAIVEQVGLENAYIYSSFSSGAIAGAAEYAMFKRCYNAAYLVSETNAGGLVAGTDSANIILNSVYNAGEIKIIGGKETKTKPGQIVGHNFSSMYDNMQYSICYVRSDLNIDFCGNASYYNVECTFLPKKSFYNGEVAYLLSQLSSTWGQDLSSENSLPRPCASDKYPVYKTCEREYTNDVSKVHHSIVNGLCINAGCDYYEGEPHYNEQEGVYEISNAGQLYDYANKAQTVYTKGAKLMADIVVNKDALIQADGTPVTDTADIRTWNGLFRVRGRSKALTFDGNNHSISGLYAKGSGLQGFVLHNPGTVKNLQIKNSVFISTDGTAGGIAAGYTSYTATFKIQNCSFEGYVEGAKYAGGIAGENAHTSNCYADAYVAGSGVISPIVAHPSITGSAGTITNTAYNTDKYTAECTITGIQGFTTDQFTSGEVAYTLNQGSSDTTADTWKQTLDGEDKDSTPTLHTASGTVYRYNSTDCAGKDKNPIVYVYTNDVNKKDTNVNDPHTYAPDTENLAQHKCSECGAVEDHTFSYKKADNGNAIVATCSECKAAYTVKLTKPAATADGKLVYDGTAKKAEAAIESGNTGIETIPESAITYAAVTDVKTSDYSTTVPKDAGTYKAKLTLGTGDNAVSVDTTFTIAKAAPQMKWSESDKSQSLSYTGSEIPKNALIKPTITLQGSDSFSDWDKVTYSYQKLESGVAEGDVVTGKLPTDVGTYAVRVSILASDDGNYTEASSEAMTLMITQAVNQLTSALTCADYIYEKGKTPAPSAEAQFGEVTYKYAKTTAGNAPTGEDAYLETPPTDAGTYAVKAYVQETANYKGLVSAPLTFTIAPSSDTPNMPDAAKTLCPAHSTDTVGQIALPTDWSWSEADRNKALTDAVTTATAVYTGSDSGKGNYVTESVVLTIQRSACDHRNKTFQNEVKATCTTGGFSGDVYCADCHAFIEYGKATAALGHTYGTPQYVWGTDADGNVICTALKTCTREGCTAEEADHAITETVKATGAVTKKPTCTEKGTKTYTATFSKEGFAVQTKDENIAATGHTLTYVPAKEATATIAGNKAYFVCGDCGKYYEDSAGTKEITDKSSVIIPAKGTTPVTPSGPTPTPGGTSNPIPTPGGTSNPTPSPDGTSTPSTTPAASPSANPTTVPTVAPSTTPVKPNGSKIKDSTGTTYKVTDAKSKTPTVQYAAPKSGAKGIVTIPTTVTIDKVTYKVTSIADNAFKGNKKIKKVVIGSNIVSIGKNAFAKCTNLTSITIGKNVTKIGKNVFNGCKKLKTLIIKSKKLTAKSVAKGAFKGIGKKAVVKVPKSKYKAYKKLLCAKGLSKKVKIKK